MTRVVEQGWFSVPFPPHLVLPLLTAVGETRWVDGWEPVFPEPARHDVGEVWLTAAHGVTTTWVTVERTAEQVRYARVTPGVSAGTVTVRCRPALDGATDVDVAYDLTALGTDGQVALTALRAGFADMLEEWRRGLTAALSAPAAPAARP